MTGRQSVFSDSLGIAYKFQTFFHRSLGRVVFFIGIVHGVISLLAYHTGGVILSTRSRITGFTVCGSFPREAVLALFALTLFSFSYVRRKFYESFCYFHVFFAAVIVLAGYAHMTPIGVSNSSAILFIITGSMYLLLFSMRTGMLILQPALVSVGQGDGLLKIELRLWKPTRITAGQHIWLRIPSTSYTSFAESHPFMIASWHKTEDGRADRITILVEPKRGFTRKLKLIANSNPLTFHNLENLLMGKKAESKLYRKLATSTNIDEEDFRKSFKELENNTSTNIDAEGFIKQYKEREDSIKTELELFNHAFFEGPYGRPIGAEEFGTVILYATGIGIGAQLATVKHLLESREAGTAKTQRVTLLWEVDHVFVEYGIVNVEGEEKEKKGFFVKEDTAEQMVMDLLQQDCNRLSKLRLDREATFHYKSGWQGAPPEQGYMFRCTRYVRNKPPQVKLAFTEEDEVNQSGTHSLRTKYRELDPRVSLESQLQHDNCRGRVLVSDSIRSIVAEKGLYLHEHEFRPES
ncbi:hypothetical protein ACMFMG_012018 [Clarireedia jacksonii]